MNFKNLEYFREIATEKSIRKAAAKLYISEQSLGENIHRLEGELGVKLMNNNRPLELTEAGKVFLKYVEEILNKKEKMIADTLAAAGNNGNRTVVVSVGPSTIPPFLPMVLAAFQRQYPQYKVTMLQKDRANFERFSEDELFFMPRSHDEAFECIPVFQDEPVVLVKEKLLKEYYPERWQEVLEEVKISKSLKPLEELPFADWNKDDNIGFRRLKERIQEMDFHPKMFELSLNQEANYEFCKQGLCALVGMKDLSLRIAGDHGLEDNGIYMLPLELKDLEIVVGLHYLKKKERNEAEIAFCEFVKSYFKFE